MKKDEMRIVVLTGGKHKGNQGYCHGIFQYGDSEYGQEANMIVELSNGDLIREPIEYVKFID